MSLVTVMQIPGQQSTQNPNTRRGTFKSIRSGGSSADVRTSVAMVNPPAPPKKNRPDDPRQAQSKMPQVWKNQPTSPAIIAHQSVNMDEGFFKPESAPRRIDYLTATSQQSKQSTNPRAKEITATSNSNPTDSVLDQLANLDASAESRRFQRSIDSINNKEQFGFEQFLLGQQ